MTAVEKLELRLLGIVSFDSEELRARYKEAIKQAKEMEKQQIIDAFHKQTQKFYCEQEAEQYYKETFN